MENICKEKSLKRNSLFVNGDLSFKLFLRIMKFIRSKNKNRILVKKTNKYFYASLIDSLGVVRFTRSTLAYRKEDSKGKSFKSADFIKNLANEFSDLLKSAKYIDNLCFDRGGHLYCGIIKSFADGLRQNDIKI